MVASHFGEIRREGILGYTAGVLLEFNCIPNSFFLGTIGLRRVFRESLMTSCSTAPSTHTLRRPGRLVCSILLQSLLSFSRLLLPLSQQLNVGLPVLGPKS